MTPTLPMRMPPIAGPATAAKLLLRLARLFAAAIFPSPTSRGIIACWAPAPDAYADVSTNALTKHAHTRGWASSAFPSAIAAPTAIPVCWISISRRRSSASASAPPRSVSVSSGTSWTRASSPTASVDPVSA